MKKLFISLTVLFVLVMSACSNGSTDKKNDAKDKKSETITYQSENGKVEVPANPQRVVVLSSFAGNVMSLGVNLVGVDSWSKQNPRFDSKLKNVAEVSDENVEKIAELNPDLIIGLSNIKNVDKLKKIAPTVTYTYGKVDYLTQHLEIGKLLNKEKEAKTWVDDFKKRAQTAGKDIKAKIGEDATVSVVENFNKQLYVYGENWGRGTEILYQEMKLKMPEKVKEKALKEGYYALSTEVLPEFAGDYLIVSKNKDTGNSFQETESYKNIPAVKNNRVYEANMMEFYFNDPLTLDFQLDFFKKSFLGQ
ncbi:iron-hydroxamate ABC transporter substrate-binding protein [Bacillus nitratireducens]|uniref:Iron-hydroxamate ABC transporter substrate-binding protein n=1 Tax=Bacillus nitratireducens TaxID=2026193 RepID=A0ABU6PDA8_9BACI|nr:iron-hydroxamate ABC transporter substrate-binding protein [Bacillus nitratireducens]MDR4172680.1 iron-hydroxamate ABC transporter substrate-binding protein [Bacillus nitratireducens]MED4679268.1 iron-hydroxamate ABC transporter substrate-binding protein [Bacillus nitratireducens]